MWRAFVYDARRRPRSRQARLPRVRAARRHVPRQRHRRRSRTARSTSSRASRSIPLFGAMPQTPLMAELQITQEYLGQSTHLVYLAPMWKEFLDADTYADGPGRRSRGRRRHAQGQRDRHRRRRQHRARRQLVRPRLRAGELVRLRPAGLEPGADRRRDRRRVDPHDVEQRRRRSWRRFASMMLDSREAFVDYTMPLGPAPPDRRRPLRADAGEHRPAPRRLVGDSTITAPTRAGIGFDRTQHGQRRASSQYRSPLREQWSDPATDAGEPAALVPPPAVGLPDEVGAERCGTSSSSTTPRAPTRRRRLETRWARCGQGGRRAVSRRCSPSCSSRRRTPPRGATSASPTSSSSRAGRREPLIRGRSCRSAKARRDLRRCSCYSLSAGALTDPIGHVVALAVLEPVEVRRHRRCRPRSWHAMPTKAPVKFGRPGAVASSERMLASNCCGSQCHSSAPSTR